LVAKDGLDPETLKAKLEESALGFEVALQDLRQRRHPVQADMLAALFKRLLEVIRLHLVDTPLQELEAGAAPLLSEANELATWLVDPRNGPPVAEIQADIDLWVSSYANARLTGVADYAETLKKAWLGRPRGRPSVQKKAAVRALEMKLANPELSWKKLASELLPPKKQANIDSPEQCLRQEVMALRRVLRKYGIPGWEPFERLATRKT
jgi:hypothetical protein